MHTETSKCPNCGGPLHFEPEIQKNKCSYCLSEFSDEELEKINAKEESVSSTSLEEEKDQADSSGHVIKEYRCDSCGAEVVTDDTTSASFCYYCHNPVILTDRLEGEFKPDKLIPFKISKEMATEKFVNWARRYRFVPKDFYSKAHLEKMTGIYVPNWMANVKLKANYSGVATNIRVWQSGDREYTESKKYLIERRGDLEMAKLPNIAIKKLDKDLISSINPYNYKEAVDFKMSYLNGFFSEKYDIEKESFTDVVLEDSKKYGDALVRSSVSGYSNVTYTEREIDSKIQSWEYTLLPVWIITYNFLGNIYIYAVNGQNGKAFGQLPLDSKSLFRFSLILGLVVLVLFLIGGYLI